MQMPKTTATNSTFAGATAINAAQKPAEQKIFDDDDVNDFEDDTLDDLDYDGVVQYDEDDEDDY